MNRTFWVVTALLCGLPLFDMQGMGPFDIEFRAFELCSDARIHNPMIYNTKYSKVGRKKVIISFDVYAPHGLNDDFVVKLDIATKTANGFKHNFLNIEGPVIQSMKTYSPQYYKLIKKFPVPSGNYSVKNLPMNINATLIKSFFYGTYMIITNTYWKKERVSCVDLVVELVPVKKKS